MLFNFTLKKQRNEEDMDVDSWNVKNLKENNETVAPNEYFDLSWASHQTLIVSILRGETNHFISIQTAYELSTDLCNSGQADTLYKRLYDELESHFIEVANLLTSMATSNDDFLGYLNTVWNEKKNQINQISQIFCELDRGYVLRNTVYRSISDIGTHLFKKHILTERLVKERLLRNLLFLIQNDRKGRMVDTELIESLVQLLQDAGMYKTDFEPRLLESMSSYYEHEAERLIDRLSVPNYLLYANHQRSLEESQQTYLIRSTRQKLAKIVSEKLAQSNMATLVEKGLYTMIDTNDYNSLSMLYETCVFHGLNILRESIMLYIKTRGSTLFEQHQESTTSRSDSKFFKLLMKFKSKLERAVQEGLKGDSTLSRAVGDAFGELFGEHEHQVARLLVKYIDTIMQHMESDEQAKSGCEQALAMFRYLQEKDTFEGLYKIPLAKRLLYHTSRLAHESIMADQLASACGVEYVKEIHAMISDATTSQELTDEFNSTQGYDNSLSIMTLEKTQWSSYLVKEETSLPPQFVPVLKNYEAFYKEKNSKRQIEWAHYLGTCMLKAQFPSGSKTLVVNFTQARILLEFNNIDKSLWTLAELSSSLSIEHHELETTLKSLCHQNAPILNAITDNSSQAKYQYNPMFKDKRKFIVINRTAEQQVEQSKLANRVTNMKLNDNRKYQIEAAIVRVMKKKRKFRYVELRNAVQSMLPFKVETPDFSAGVDSVIKKGLIERKAKQVLMYVA